MSLPRDLLRFVLVLLPLDAAGTAAAVAGDPPTLPGFAPAVTLLVVLEPVVVVVW